MIRLLLSSLAAGAFLALIFIATFASFGLIQP